MLYPIDRIWSEHLDNILTNGIELSPRGLPTKTLFNARLEFDPKRSVILNQSRDLNYRFMMAEAVWILDGDNTVAGIAPWNPNIAKFSDDGVSFFGAYGPKVVSQLDYVVEALQKDSYTRQAVMTIWREDPPITKDYPCTISLIFYRRMDELDCTVTMRSSDAWLGVPYDIFNFSMILASVAARAEMDMGQIVLNMVNAHLYEPSWDKAYDAVQWEIDPNNDNLIKDQPYCHPDHSSDLMASLVWCRSQVNKAECLEQWRKQ